MRGKRVRQANPGSFLVMAAAVVLAGCAAGQDVASADAAAHTAGAHPAAAADLAVPGGATRWGDSIVTMAEQYRPRAGAVAAAGASAWVKSAPSPAFVLSAPLPPPDPPAPPPAAVANRQPAAPSSGPQSTPTPAPARPAVAASDIARPEAAAPAAPDPTVRTRGLALFNDYSCGACHVLAEARAAGSIGPSLDRNPGLTRAFVLDVITNGRGAMPAFGGQMTDAEIEILADYIVQFARR